MAKAKVIEVIDGLVIEGLSKDDAIELMRDFGIKKTSVALKYWSAHGSKGISGGVFQLFLDFLAEKPRTQSALADFLIKESSPNECRWFAQRDSIRKLSIRVFTDLGVEFTEKEVTKDQTKSLEARYK